MSNFPQAIPQPETIMIEASNNNSSQSSENNDEWECAIPPIRLEQGDEISVNTSFLEARGTSTDILEFSSSGLNQNNKQTIYFEYYGCDDGTNDKNKGKDWYNYNLNNTAGQTNIATSKSYNPCKAFRYDRLWDETTFNANGNAFNRDIGRDTTISSVVSTATNPLIANAFNIEPREDYLVGGVFNSIPSIKEVNDNTQHYVGQPNFNAKQEPVAEGLLRMSDSCINLDVFPYWEIFQDTTGDNVDKFVRIRIPYTAKGQNYLAQFPVGTIIQLGLMPQRRQFSHYDTTNNARPDIAFTPNDYEKISGRFAGICGHFYISSMGENTFADDATDAGITGITPYGVASRRGWYGKACFELRIRQYTTDTTINNARIEVSMGSKGTGTKRMGISAGGNGLIFNKSSTFSDRSLLYIAGSDADRADADKIPMNLMIRKSPYYIGSQIKTTSFTLPDDICLMPSVKVQSGDNFRTTEDADLFELFPNQSIDPDGNAGTNADRDIYVGQYHFQNNDRTFITGDDPQNQNANFANLSNGQPIGKMIKYYTANKTTPYNPFVGELNADWTWNDNDGGIPYVQLKIPVSPPLGNATKANFPDHTICVFGYQSGSEEVVYLGQMWGLTDVVGNAYTANFEVLARNMTENQGIFTNSPTTHLSFDASNPVSWVGLSASHTPIVRSSGTTMRWYDFEEAKSADFAIDPDLLRANCPTGLPVLRNNGYMGSNQPSLEDSSEYTPEILDNYKFGTNYFLYHNTSRGDLHPNEFGYLPDCSFTPTINEDVKLTEIRGRLGRNKGCFMFDLTEAMPHTTANTYQFAPNFNTPTLIDMRAQITQSWLTGQTYPHMTGVAGTEGQAYGEIYQHSICWNMKGDYENSKAFMDKGGIDPVRNLYTFNNNLYVWSPDALDSLSPSTNTNTLKLNTNQGIHMCCGYVPFINKITISSVKDYMTPTDLSNFWTEELHKLTDMINLYDGTTIEGSAKRGVLQNPCLQPIYGSWGLDNVPLGTGLLKRDYITFPMTSGYALGSVLFLDGNTMPDDWLGTSQFLKERTMPIYPRSPNNIINLWDTATPFKLPTFAINRLALWTNADTSTRIRESLSTTRGYTEYPHATSALCNNTTLSSNIATGRTNALSPTNLAYLGGKSLAEPNYSVVAKDANDILPNAGAGDLDYPFEESTDQGFREDAIYRETEDYPLIFFKDPKYENYLKFSQYVGSDNMTLTYNTLVSAFEFQFLHQPFATSFVLNDGVPSGGDNAIRIFDNVPKEVSNWERYGGLNIRNWCSPNIPRGSFTYAEVLTPPQFTQLVYPNGINPEITLEKIGKAFMLKVGYTEQQLTQTAIKGREEWVPSSGTADLGQYFYEPIGTTGADPDIADAIINTSVSAEDNPNSEAHNGKGQLIFYPQSADTAQKTIRNKPKSGDSDPIAPLGVRYDFSYTNFGQRGGVKTQNHNKGYGFPNITGSPLVKDTSTFPITLNPDGEQRSGYTIEIGSSPIRAVNLPIKLTDGYYYILCPDLIDDPQFYITAYDGSVIPAIAIISKTYVSGDFYTSFQSPITFYCKKPKTITSIRVQIRNSTMGIPSNLGSNSSVIFSIRRMNPTPPAEALTTSQQQDLDYAQLQKGAVPNVGSKLMSTISDIFQLDMGILMPFGNPADGTTDNTDVGSWDLGTQTEEMPIAQIGTQSSGYYNDLLQRINNVDLPSMNQHSRDEFFKTPQGTGIKVEMGNVIAERRSLLEAENESDPMNILLDELNRDQYRNPTTPMKGVREGERIAKGEAPLTGGRREDVEDIRNVMGNKTSSMGGSIGGGEVPDLVRKETKDSGIATTIAPSEAPTEVQEED